MWPRTKKTFWSSREGKPEKKILERAKKWSGQGNQEVAIDRRCSLYRLGLQKSLPHKQSHLNSNSSALPHTRELINVYYGNYTDKQAVIHPVQQQSTTDSISDSFL